MIRPLVKATTKNELTEGIKRIATKKTCATTLVGISNWVILDEPLEKKITEKLKSAATTTATVTIAPNLY